MRLSTNLKIAIATVAALFLVLIYILFRDNAKSISGYKLDVLMQKHLITKVVERKPYLYIKTEKSLYKIPIDGVNLKKIASRYPVEIVNPKGFLYLILGFGVIFLSLFAGWFIARKIKTTKIKEKSISSNDKNRTFADNISPIKSDINFNDVAGLKSVKGDVLEIIDFLKYPLKYRQLDIRLPKGILLVGPPGVGKTWIAKAIAGEAKVPFFYQSGANIVEIYVGMGAKRVHQLFEKAKREAPSIIFIDEIDAVGKKRGAGGNDEREATLNQLLTEMDGFESHSGVVVIGATNRVEILDDALLRPGRFDRRIYIPLPDREERYSILNLYLKNKPHRVDLDYLSYATVGFSASALAVLVNEAALYALKSGRREILDDDFRAVQYQVINGKRKILSYSDDERKVQALYQSAKVLVATWLGVPYNKIGIVTTLWRDVEKEILSKSDILGKIKARLAGSVAVRELLGESYSNGAEDLKYARAEAEKMIFEYGMGDSIYPSEKDVKDLIDDSIEELKIMLKKLEVARVEIEKYLLENENIDEESARRVLREIF